jgi:hypothetical protein
MDVLMVAAEILNQSSMKTFILFLFTLVTTVVYAQSSNVDSVLVICKSEAISSLKRIVEKDFGSPTESKKKAIKVATLTRYEARVNYLNSQLQKDLPSTSLGLDSYTKGVFAEYKKMFPELKNDFYERATKRIQELKQ